MTSGYKPRITLLCTAFVCYIALMRITYITGDATKPVGDKPIILAHICNDVGGWGAGFVLAISKRWETPESEFYAWYERKQDFALGNVQFVTVEDGLLVANMIGQHDIYPVDGVPPIRYDAVQKCLSKVRKKAESLGATIHMPKIGAGLAGGDWAVIEEIIQEELCNNGISVTVYTLPKPKSQSK